MTFAYTINLESVNLMNGLKVISKGMFRSSALQKVTIPSSVTYIGLCEIVFNLTNYIYNIYVLFILL